MAAIRNDKKNKQLIYKEKIVYIKKRLNESKYLYLIFALPLIYILIFKYGAIFWLSIAFKDYNAFIGLAASPWVGFKYFKLFIEDPYFWKLIRNTVLLNTNMIFFFFPVPIILALMINDIRNRQFKKFVQTVTYLPYFLSTVVVCGLLVNTLSSDGIFNKIINALGGKSIPFLTTPAWFRPIYILSEVWQKAGWGSIIYLAALTGINTQLYEAAMIDGANKWQQTWYISIPGIAPVISIQLLLTIGRILSVGYEKILLLYNGSTYETADVISTYVFRRGIMGADYSYGTAVGLFQAVLGLILVVLANKAASKIGQTSLW